MIIISFNTVSLLSRLPQHCPAWFKTVQPVSKGSRRFKTVGYIEIHYILSGRFLLCPDCLKTVRKVSDLKMKLEKTLSIVGREIYVLLVCDYCVFFLCRKKYICALRLRKKKSQFNKMDNLLWRSCNIWTSLDPKNVVSKNPRVIFSAAIFLIYNPVTFSSDPHQLIS